MKKSLSLVIALTSTCLIASLGLALVNALTQDRIEEQKNKEMLLSINKVLPLFNNNPLKDKKETDGTIFFMGKYNGRVTGVACQTAGEGYSAKIRVMVGLNLEGEISGVEILEHLETPGLGSRIETPEFKTQFKGKSPVNFKIDSLTGATISSRGVAQAVRQALDLFQKNKKTILNAD
ncbi:MAG: RnfABCDGE type electron transport complex subunit G [Candidatus Omnitrophota bacterium]|nr:RnfABCDGE type electron transport complex subunit G [Candidatus Omnitrophota bacterium]